MLLWLKKVSSVKKLPISNAESFLEPIFDPNQIYKILLTQNLLIWKFNATDLLDIFLEVWRNALMIYKISKKKV